MYKKIDNHKIIILANIEIFLRKMEKSKTLIKKKIKLRPEINGSFSIDWTQKTNIEYLFFLQTIFVELRGTAVEERIRLKFYQKWTKEYYEKILGLVSARE